MTESSPSRRIVVGVTPRQPELVLRTAARLARALGAELVCAHVDSSAYVVEEHQDGSVTTRPLDPDLQDWTASPFDASLAERIERLGAAAGVAVRTCELAGDVARALGRLAEMVGAELIVVGTRSGIRAGVREYLGGSVAVHLAHRQPVPVVVVPLAPRAHGPLPWEEQ